MNYEDLYQAYLTKAKNLKDVNNTINRLNKAIGKEMESGDLKSFDRDCQLLRDAITAQSGIVEEIQALVSSFDRNGYFNGGDFASQMLEICQSSNVDVRGEFPVYEMFPYRVRMDSENLDVYIDRKKVQCLRPKSLVQKISDGQVRLNKASFNATAFLNELADAYDLALLKTKKRPDADIYLSKLYKFLVPMSRSRKEYDQQSYAFDLARLYAAGMDLTVKDDRHYQFGPSHDNGKAIRILDSYGREQFLTTIKFYHE